MKQISQQKGFTIIEVVLFLAIAGLLAMGLFVGAGAAIQQQQYRDAVQSYAGFLRSQYDRVINVENARSEAAPSECGGSANERGRSGCVVVGRYIRSEDISGGTAYGAVYEAYPVYGWKESTGWKYQLGDADAEYALRWSAKTRFSSQTDGASQISLLMYRHPEQGSLVIRSADTFYNLNTIGTLFTTGSAAEREVCVYDTGWLAGMRQSVFLGAGAASSDAVTVANASEECNKDV